MVQSRQTHKIVLQMMYKNFIVVPCPRSEYISRETSRLQHDRPVFSAQCMPGLICGWAKQAEG